MFFSRHFVKIWDCLERLHDPHTMSKSTDIRTLRVQPLFGLGEGPSFFTFYYSDDVMKRTSSTASLLSTKRILFFRVRRQPRQDSKKDEWTIPMENLPLTKHCSESLFVPHAVFSSWNRDQVIFLPCLSIRFNDIHLTQNTYVSPGALNEDFAMKGWLQWNRGCSRIVDESADGFILMDGTSHALLTRRGHLCFIVKTRLAFFARPVQPCFFLETLRGLFDIFVVVVCIVFPNKIALRHFSSIMVAISFDDFSMLLPFVKIHDLSTFRSRPFVWIRSVYFT